MAVRVRAKTADRPSAPSEPGLLTVSRPELLVNGSDAHLRTLIHRLLSFSRFLTAMCEGFGELVGVTGVQYEIMMWVSRLQGTEGITVGEVSKAMRQSGAFTTIETGKLVEMGLLEKFSDLKDRRRVRMRITDAGRERLTAVIPHQRRINDTLFASVKPNGLENLNGTVGELLSDAEQASNLMEFLLRQERGQTVPRSI